MLFQVYGENALYQWLGWAIVFIGNPPYVSMLHRPPSGPLFPQMRWLVPPCADRVRAGS